MYNARMSKHHHHPYQGHHNGMQSGHHHRGHAGAVTAGGKAHAKRTLMLREEHSAEIEPLIAAWQQELAAAPPTNETPISPLAVPMRITSQFDSPRHGADKKYYPHNAVDGAPAIPTEGPVEIKAALSGRVLFAGNWDPDSGNSVIIGGDDGRIYSYAHLAKGAVVQVGQKVVQGATIGIMGTTGNAHEGPCLHYKVREPVETDARGHVVKVSASDGIVAMLDEADTDFARVAYKAAWPRVAGVALRTGMVVEPAQLIAQNTPSAAGAPTFPPIDAATLQQMGALAHTLSPGYLPDSSPAQPLSALTLPSLTNKLRF